MLFPLYQTKTEESKEMRDSLSGKINMQKLNCEIVRQKVKYKIKVPAGIKSKINILWALEKFGVQNMQDFMLIPNLETLIYINIKWFMSEKPQTLC